ncbi:MAG: family 78 glycoside hydrolase catalytic domain [Eubacteriales bacterium]|nr:family 78 glycoside hydrolase catalytic domain [Eubacteriales bacterium]
MNLYDLEVEYQSHPIGLDSLPRFSWKIASGERDVMQSAYRITVRAEGDGRKVWDSGERRSDASVLIEYAGEALAPRSVYEVAVTVWDNHRRQAQARAVFETGLLGEAWKGNWITCQEEPEALPVFYREFALQDMSLRRARLYATACGVYEARLNGEKAGDCFLAPGWTSYHHRLQYQTYDVTAMLHAGSNRIELCVGNGWYRGYLNCEGERAFYGDRLAVRAMLYCEYEDGSVQCLATGDDWKVTTSEIVSAELYCGETQDYTATPASEKQACLLEEEPKGEIVAQQSEPVRITKRIPAVRKIVTPKGELVLDFGQNMAGLVQIELPALQGDTLRITHAETLDRDGNFYTDNYRSAVSEDIYRYGPEEIGRVVMPHFTYHGFRYIRAEGVGEDVDMGRFTACAMHTDMARIGLFRCSNEQINRLQQNIEWGQRSNYFDIPTDCPQRDERLGWTGDAQIFAATGCFQFRTARFWTKWLRDVAAESTPENGVPQIVPNIIPRTVGTSVWSDCATVIPWCVYQSYGDVRVLEEQYETMRLWVEYIRRRAAGNGLWMDGFQRGDWLSLDSDESLHLMSGATDRNLIANVYYAVSTRILRDSARVLGREEDAGEYGTLYEGIVRALRAEYVTATGRLVSETQTACALLLHFGLLEEKDEVRAAQLLEENLSAHRGHLTTGFVGTAFLCHALSDHERHSLAADVLLAEDYPGWLYAVNRGATTIWERWNSILPDGSFDQSGMNSLNHYSFGSIGDWIYQKIGGIRPLEPGYKKILIRPLPTRTMPQVETSLESPYGTIACSLCYADGQMTVKVTVPANTTAVLELPGRERESIGSGEYSYRYALESDIFGKRYGMNSTVAEIAADPQMWTIFCDMVPGMRGNTMMSYLRDKTLAQLAAMSPDFREHLESAVARMNE